MVCRPRTVGQGELGLLPCLRAHLGGTPSAQVYLQPSMHRLMSNSPCGEDFRDAVE